MQPSPSKLTGRKELIIMELLAALLLTLLLLGLALLAPIGYGAPPGENPAAAEITAPWLMIWLQVLLRHLPPFVAGLLIPLAIVGLLAVFPWLPGADRPDSRYHFGLHLALILALGCGLALLTFWGL